MNIYLLIQYIHRILYIFRGIFLKIILSDSGSLNIVPSSLYIYKLAYKSFTTYINSYTTYYMKNLYTVRSIYLGYFDDNNHIQYKFDYMNNAPRGTAEYLSSVKDVQCSNTGEFVEETTKIIGFIYDNNTPNKYVTHALSSMIFSIENYNSIVYLYFNL